MVAVVGVRLFFASRPIRTAIGKAKRGSFKDTQADELLKPVLAKLRAVVEEHGVAPSVIGDIVVGTVLPRGGKVCGCASDVLTRCGEF